MTLVMMRDQPEAGGDTGHGEGDEVVEVAVGGGGQLQRAEADVVQSLVVDAERLVGVLDQLVDGQGGVVGFHHCVGHCGGALQRHPLSPPAGGEH